jgi:choline/glycine/proline betaine transport protein
LKKKQSMEESMASTPTSRMSFKEHIRPGVFYPAAGLILLFVALGMIMPKSMQTALGKVNSWITGGLGWYYILIVAGFVAVSLFIGFSRYGKIRLSKDGERPEFSRVSWFAMLFSAGMGIGLMFWGVAEPLSHYASPPARTGLNAETVNSAEQAIHLAYVHWGLHAWAIYVIVGLALAFATHRKGRPLSIRWALEPLLGDRVKGWLGDAIDVAAIFGTVFGVATSLGFGVLQINAGLDFLGVTGVSLTAQLILIGIITSFAVASVISGLGRGIKWLSNANIGLAGILLAFVLIAGPTLFIIREFVASFGYYLQNVLQTTFASDAFIQGPDFVVSWTAFYWGWWISWAPFVGVFIARISRGRTIREFTLGVLLVPTLITFFWFSVFGGAGLYRELFGGGGLTGLASEQALFQLLDGLPFGGIVSAVAVALIVTFFVTSSDSGSLVVDMLAGGGDLNPPVSSRVFWGLTEGAVAAALLWVGGTNALGALQTASIATALPFSIVMVLMVFATLKALKTTYRENGEGALAGRQ